MQMLGYGEDALTLHALTKGLARILAQLGDDSDADNALVFYRPSFGRRSSAPSGTPRSEFGEFDSIIGTRCAVYLVEAKWSASGELDGADLKLRPEQLRRHKAFRTYLQEWRRERPASWAAFVTRMAPILRAEGIGLVPPGSGTTLGRNLEYILRQLDGYGPQVIDVLLFCRLSEAMPAPATCGSFTVVTHTCSPAEGSGFVRLAA